MGLETKITVVCDRCGKSVESKEVGYPYASGGEAIFKRGFFKFAEDGEMCSGYDPEDTTVLCRECFDEFINAKMELNSQFVRRSERAKGSDE